MEEIRFNLAAPNLLCICVDDRQHGESSGRGCIAVIPGKQCILPMNIS